MKKTIIITGASRGIGLAIAKQLLVEGHEVIGISRSHTLNHDNYIPKKIDLADLRFLPDHLRAIQLEFPEVNALICNAGIQHTGPIEDLSFVESKHIVELNFLSHVYLVKTFLPQMKLQKGGSILFLGSSTAQKAPANQSMYAASKSALSAFAKSLRFECAEDNIRVTTIHPGAVKTEISAEKSSSISLEDIAELISYLLSRRSGAVLDEIYLSPQQFDRAHLDFKPTAL